MARTGQIRAQRPAPTTTSTSLDDYSDTSSTYWPIGWSFARFRTCEQADLLALPEGELEKLQAGFRAALGEDGVATMGEALFAESQSRQQKQARPGSKEISENIPVMRPNWLTTYKRRGAGRHWGHIGLRTCLYEDEERWKEYKTKLEKIARLPFEADEAVPGVQEAATRFCIWWQEDETKLKDASLDTLQREFVALSSTHVSAPSSLFLLATPTTVDALLAADTPMPGAAYWRPDPPYVLATPACRPGGRAALEEDTDDWENYKEVFRVAAETLVAELWMPLMEMGSSPWKLARPIKGWRWREGEVVDDGEGGDDVWWSSFPNPF